MNKAQNVPILAGQMGSCLAQQLANIKFVAVVTKRNVAK
jgi:hypothetical protein